MYAQAVSELGVAGDPRKRQGVPGSRTHVRKFSMKGVDLKRRGASG